MMLVRVGFLLLRSPLDFDSAVVPGPATGDGLLLENGSDFLLLEDGSFLLLE